MTRLPNYTWVLYRKPYQEFIGEITKQPHSKIFSQLWKDTMHYFKDINLNVELPTNPNNHLHINVNDPIVNI